MSARPDQAAQASPAGSDEPSPRAGARVSSRRRMLLFSLAAVGLLLITGLVGFIVGSARTAPAEDSADVGFARDMQTHHAQAVQMAMIIRDKTTDPTMRAIADDITTSQQHQAGQMYAWLAQWGLPQTGTDEPMAWMTAGVHNQSGHTPVPSGPTGPSSTAQDESTVGGATLMGMASPQQIRALQQATGSKAETLFLELMITHHQGGVAMARAALERAGHEEVRTLAAAIHTAQTAEINQLREQLEQRR